MVGITIAEVAGLVAFTTAIVGFIGPNLIALLLAARVGHERSAGTWSVVGRELQSTNWPLFLRTDTAASRNIPRSVSWLCWLQKLAWVLVTVAGIVTPFGLSSKTLVDANPRKVEFATVKDEGPVGKGTPPRDPDAFFNRVCWRYGESGGFSKTFGHCPFSTQQIKSVYDGEFLPYSIYNGSYDNRIPHETAEIFSSLHDEHAQTISGAFDIEWRQYTYLSVHYDNQTIHKPFQVGVYRPLDMLILDDKIEPIDGLVIDTRNGGIALRNHTAPKVELGGEWTEELLFISPESKCVDTNLTFEYEIANTGADSCYSGFCNTALVDGGGFANIKQTYPEPEGGVYGGQDELDLQFRAYKAAWINNVWSMFYLNATNPSVGEYEEAFEYMNTHVGKRFYVDAIDAGITGPNALQMTQAFGSYLAETGYYDDDGEWNPSDSYNDRKKSAEDERTVYQNPFHVSQDNFSTASILCSGAGAADKSNITNVAVACGLMYGAATRKDGQSSLISTPGSQWTQRLYSCATALKADIKLVTFAWNDTTSHDGNPMESLSIKKIEDKSYARKVDEPYWAVENLHQDLANNNPLWGLVSSRIAKLYKDERLLNFSQSPRLFLPGYTGDDYLSPQIAFDDNLATSNAFALSLGHLYNVPSSEYDVSPYAGKQSLSLFQKWQRLSTDVDSAAKIPNLILTDLIANSVMGTRSQFSADSLPDGLQPKRSSTKTPIARRDVDSRLPISNAEVPVRQYRDGVTYEWIYAIPAFLTLALLAVILILVAYVTIIEKTRAQTMHFYLNWTSPGRLLAAIQDQQSQTPTAIDTSYRVDAMDKGCNMKDSDKGGNLEDFHIMVPSKEWPKTHGKRIINLDAVGECCPNEQSSANGRYKSLAIQGETERSSLHSSKPED